MHSLNRDNAQTLRDPAQRAGAGCWLPRAAPSKELGSPVRPLTACARARCKTAERLLPSPPRSLKQPAPQISFREQKRVLAWVCRHSEAGVGGMPVQRVRKAPSDRSSGLVLPRRVAIRQLWTAGAGGCSLAHRPRHPHAVCSLWSPPSPCSARACFPPSPSRSHTPARPPRHCHREPTLTRVPCTRSPLSSQRPHQAAVTAGPRHRRRE